MAVPTLLHGCETWALDRSDKRKIEIVERRLSRYIAVCTRSDEISNLTFRSELQVFIINDKITDKNKEWHVHIQRMDHYRIARKADEYKPIGH
jgi:hypothetical protein